MELPSDPSGLNDVNTATFLQKGKFDEDNMDNMDNMFANICKYLQIKIIKAIERSQTLLDSCLIFVGWKTWERHGNAPSSALTHHQ